MTRHRLALTIGLRDMETPASFVARLARRNGSIPREFCSDLAMRWPEICSGHTGPLERLADLSGASFEALTLAAAGRVSPLRFRVGHSTATSGTFRRAVTRVCPRCTVEAIDKSGDTGPFQRLEWLLLPLMVCREHQVELITIERASNTHKTYDVVERVFAHHQEVCVASAEAQPITPTEFETYLCMRANVGPQGDWLDGWTLTDLDKGALTLGMQRRFGPAKLVTELNQMERRDAAADGFEILRQGSDALMQELERLRCKQSGGRPYFTRDMGAFYVWLKETQDAPQLAEIRECIEQFILKSYPLQLGTPVLGAEMQKPRSVTLNQVLKQHGIGAARVRAILAHIRGGPLPDVAQSKDIALDDLDRVLAFWNSVQDLKSASSDLGILPRHVKALINIGLVRAHSLGSSLLYVDKASVASLLAKAEQLPRSIPSKSLVQLSTYCKNSKVPLPRVIESWVTGDLEGVSLDREQRGLGALLVPWITSVSKCEVRLSGDLSLTDTSRDLRIKIGGVRAMRDAGLLEIVTKRNPDTRHLKTFVTAKSLAAFKTRFVTLGQLAHAQGIAPIHLARRLDRQGIAPIDCGSQMIRVYRHELLLSETHYSAVTTIGLTAVRLRRTSTSSSAACRGSVNS